MSGGARKGRKFTLPGGRLDNLKEHAQRKVLESRPSDEVITKLSLDKLVGAPWNARRYFAAESLRTLGQDLRENGQIHPILVRPKGPNFEVVVGERRYRAALSASLPTLKAYVRTLDDAAAQRISLAENLSREDLNAYEETLGYLQLLSIELDNITEFHAFRLQDESNETAVRRLLYSLIGKASRRVNNVINADQKEPMVSVVEAVFATSGKMTWQSFVQNRLPILELPTDVLEALREGKLEYTKATALARVRDAHTRTLLLARVLTEYLSLVELRAAIKATCPAGAAGQQNTKVPERAAILARLLKKRYASQPANVQKRVEKILAELETLLDEK